MLASSLLFVSFTAPQGQRGHVPADDVVTLVPVVKLGLCRERLENTGDCGISVVNIGRSVF